MNAMSITVTADPRFFGAPATYPAESWVRARKESRSPYLTAVWIAVVLGVFAMFEPSPGDIGVAVLFVAGFFNGSLRWGQRLTLPFILLGLFVLANLTSLCYAVDLSQGMLYLAITLFMILSWLFLLGVFTKYEERGLGVVMSACTLGGVASSLLAVLCYFNLAPFGDSVLFYDRIKGFFKDPNVFGPYLVVVAVYAVHRALTCETFRRKILWVVSCLVASVGVLLCYSRAAWLNYAVTLLLFFGFTAIGRGRPGARWRNLIYFTVIAVIVGAVLAYAMTIPQIREVLSYRTEMQDYDADRFATFSAALRLGFNSPLGVGPFQSVLLLDYATHNVYLRVFSENGVIGFLSFAGFLLLTLTRSVFLSQKAGNRIQRSLFALAAAALVGTLLNSFTIDTLHWRHFWLLLALGWMPLWTRSASAAPRSGRRASSRRPLTRLTSCL
jgi:O-antigen ligase